MEEDAPSFVLRVLQGKAALMGVAQKDIVAAMRMGLSGENVTPMHGGGAKYRSAGAHHAAAGAAEQPGRAAASSPCAAQDGTLVPLSELVERGAERARKTIYHKDLLPVVFVVGDMAGKLDSPLYGMFSIRCCDQGHEAGRRAARWANISSASRTTPTPASASSGTANGR